MDTIDTYKAKKTLIVGDVNTGKTVRTTEILRLFLKAGLGRHITVLDLAPDAIDGVGGKMTVPAPGVHHYLTAPIVAPRLTAADERRVQALAQANARAITGLFERFRAQPSRILFVNDASLYLQAGDLGRFQAILDEAETAVLNAYYGDTFPDSALTRREKRMVSKLIAYCDHIIAAGDFP